MVSSKMMRYSFLLTTTVLFCVLVAVTGRPAENEEEFDIVHSFGDDKDDATARFASSGSGSSGVISSGSGSSDTTSTMLNSFIDQKIQMWNSLRPSSSNSQDPIIILVNGGSSVTSTGSGSGTASTSSGTGSASGTSFPTAAIVQAAAQAAAEAAASDTSTTTRRRRRRRRPAQRRNRGGNSNRRRKRRPNNKRRRVQIIGPN